MRKQNIENGGRETETEYAPKEQKKDKYLDQCFGLVWTTNVCACTVKLKKMLLLVQSTHTDTQIK